jgi:hypothetical protein
MQTRSRERTGAGGSFEWGALKAEIRNAAATTSRCVGSDKSGQPELRPARDYSYTALITWAVWCRDLALGYLKNPLAL